MKFKVEIVRIHDDAEQVLHEVALDLISPKWAIAKAHNLLVSWRPRGANAARVRNAKGEDVYSWKD